VLAGRWLRVPVSGPLERIVLSFTAGLGAVSLFTWLATLAGVSFDAYIAVVQWTLAVFFFVSFVLDWRAQRRGREAAEINSLARPMQWALSAVAAVLVLVTALDSTPIHFGQDSLDHIGYVRRVQVENSLTPGGVLAERRDEDNGRLEMDPRKGMIHPIVAAAARLAGADPVDAWRLLPPVVFTLAFLAFAWFCAAFVPRQSLVLACAALYLLFQGGIGVLYAREFANGQGVWLVYYWTLTPLCLRYVTSHDRRALAAILVVFSGGALMHIGVAMHFAILAATLLVFHRWLGLAARPVVTLCAWGAAVVAVVAVWKALHSLGVGNEIHVHPQGLLYVGDKLYIASPVEVLHQNGLLFLGGLALVPLMLLGARRSRHARLCLAFAAIPFLICFVPVLAPLFYEAATYMAFRSILNVPAFAAVATAVYGVVVWARRRGWLVRVVSALVLLIWAKAFLAPGVNAFAAVAATQQEARSAESLFDRYGDLLAFLRSRPGGSVVLSDAKTSYLIGAATDHRVVAAYGQHGNPNDRHAWDRLTAVRDVLSPYALQSLATAACDRYGVDFVVVNGRLENGETDYWAGWGPSMFEWTCSKLSTLETHFRPVFETGDIVVYLYYPGPRPPNTWSPGGLPVAFEAVGLDRCVVRAPEKAFEIVAADILPARTLPGEWVTITLGYEMQDSQPFGLPYLIHVRFDHASIASAERERPFEKQLRRWRERRDGSWLRYRFDHRPFMGDYPVDQWPLGVTFYESFDVKLPVALEPGTYVVEFRIEQESLLPNFTVRDFLYNRDHYSGTPCLEIEVTRQLVR
jgi:hypothetical protein